MRPLKRRGYVQGLNGYGKYFFYYIFQFVLVLLMDLDREIEGYTRVLVSISKVLPTWIQKIRKSFVKHLCHRLHRTVFLEGFAHCKKRILNSDATEVKSLV